MPPKSRSKGAGGGGKKGGDKKAEFWGGITSQKLATVRWGLANAGCGAHTRDNDGMTSIMFASATGKAKSLSAILDFYQRRRILRPKGWIDIKDDEGRTAIMMACMNGHPDCVSHLLFSEANLDLVDDTGKTAKVYAQRGGAKKAAQCLALIEEHLADSSAEEDCGDGEKVPNDGLTSTQRNKLKKRQMMEREGKLEEGNDAVVANQGGAAAADALARDGGAQAKMEEEVTSGPAPTWPEVAEVVESVKMLRPLCELTVDRSEDAEGAAAVDPALWYLVCLNRLQLRVAAGRLATLPPQVALLRNLSVLIVSHNGLTSLPEEVGRLSLLRVLEAENNALTALPASLELLEDLRTVNVSNNGLTSLAALAPLVSLENINCDRNR